MKGLFINYGPAIARRRTGMGVNARVGEGRGGGGGGQGSGTEGLQVKWLYSIFERSLEIERCVQYVHC